MKNRTNTLFWGILVVLTATLGRAQTSPLLQLTSLQVVPGNPVQFTFSDSGTGATNYQVEFTTEIGPSATWSPLGGAVITSVGGGDYQVVVPDPETPVGFFRVRGLGGSIPTVTASFNATALEVDEGGMVAPVITFSAPYFGTLRYTISGTAESGDYTSLSGEVTVNGTSATIPVSIQDNAIIGQLKHLTLSLEAGPGIQLGGGSQTIITITENDAEWQGSFLLGQAVLGFVMSIEKVGATYTATLKNGSASFFPTNEVPVSLALTGDFFSAVATDIPVAGPATLLNEPMTMTLLLTAMNGTTNQMVGPVQIEGEGTLITEVPGKPHLNVTTTGRFILLKPPPAPSTREVELTDSN